MTGATGETPPKPTGVSAGSVSSGWHLVPTSRATGRATTGTSIANGDIAAPAGDTSVGRIVARYWCASGLDGGDTTNVGTQVANLISSTIGMDIKGHLVKGIAAEPRPPNQS